MGYYISSIFGVQPNSDYSYFLYFIPSGRVKSIWINKWIRDNLNIIAKQYDEKAVIIAPYEGSDSTFLSELVGLNGEGAFFAYAKANFEEKSPFFESCKTDSEIEQNEFASQ